MEKAPAAKTGASRHSVGILGRISGGVDRRDPNPCILKLGQHVAHDVGMPMRLLQEPLGTLCADGVDATVGFDVLPAAIRLGIPLERKPLRVANVLKLQVVIVTKTITTSPCSTYVVALLFIAECMELRDEGFESGKDLHWFELSVCVGG